ncbi:hypothetical protein GCM10009839_01150 [Catenulispora yoronensis]|uniref:DoxX family protein n=1 Tax=Catenulispora yoronensis TaxID=450799 RepID=A0ABP5F096_9ACTN
MTNPNASPRLADGAVLALRLGLAIVFVAHGSQKLFGMFGGGGISGTAKFFAFVGAHPGTFWAVVGGVAEFGGGLAVGLGLLSRAAAAVLAIDMVMAVVLYNADNGFFSEKATGGWEINMVLACMALSVALTGAGRVSADAVLHNRFGSDGWTGRVLNLAA